MLIRISGRAEVTYDDGRPVAGRSIISELDGAESDDTCGNYIDNDLADLGITGGTVKLSYDKVAGQFRVSTEYGSPSELSAAQLERLVDKTVGQWSDGIGEGCFDKLGERLGVVVGLSPIDQDKELRAEQFDDGKKVSTPTGLAKAAREGDMTALRKLLDAGVDFEDRMQGYSPLHLAILYGRAEAALELIARGADINARDPDDQDPLMLTALSNSITDADAARIARVLLERRICVHGPKGEEANPTNGEYTPLYMAALREKTQLAAVLKEFGATK